MDVRLTAKDWALPMVRGPRLGPDVRYQAVLHRNAASNEPLVIRLKQGL